jgi:NAD(P)-dependent dehydrogenase (short-subunit alcohol dehydrogenase family)
VAKVVASGGEVVSIQADAGKPDDARHVIDLAVNRFGSVDILVNNAAVFPPRLSNSVGAVHHLITWRSDATSRPKSSG